MDIVEELLRQAGADEKAGTLYAHAIGRRAAREIERLRPYVDSFRREELRADIAERKVDDLRAAIRDALSSIGCGENSHAMIELEQALAVTFSDGMTAEDDKAFSRAWDVDRMTHNDGGERR